MVSDNINFIRIQCNCVFLPYNIYSVLICPNNKVAFTGCRATGESPRKQKINEMKAVPQRCLGNQPNRTRTCYVCVYMYMLTVDSRL